MKLKQAVRFAKMNSRITPRITPWLVDNPNGVRITKDEVATKVMEILRPTIAKSRAGAFHPSQLYQCPRAQVFGYHDAPSLRSYDPQLQNLFNDGHFRHLRWQIMLLESGVLTDIEVGIHVPQIRLEGSIDGVNANEEWMFELKGTSQFRSVQNNGAMPAHIKQVHAYLLASGLKEAVIVYEDKSSQQWAEILIEKNPKVISEIKKILDGLNDAIDNKYLPERLEECENQKGATYESCPYAKVCFGCNEPAEIDSFRKSQ
ncbi:MAG: hypothetical protein EBU84_13750 [Actinobacteria bacterium]|nr:hypothetical protein [Actinomycetota bacterium]